MKKLAISALLFLASSGAHANVVTVASRPIEMGGGAAFLVFNYNDAGQAWIEERDYNGYTSGDWVTSPKFPLPKLRFDPVSRQILYGRVVCATVVPMAAGFSVVNTGRCALHSAIRDYGADGPRIETVTMDVR